MWRRWAHIKISIWHLLINLKKKLLKCANKKYKNYTFLMLYFQKKIKKNTRRYYYFTPVYQKSWWYDLQFLKYRIWLTEIGNYGSFFVLLPTPLKTFLKKWKKLLETWSFYTSVPKTTIIWGMVPEICCETDRIFFCHFGPIFALLSPNNPENQNFDKMKKHLEMSSFYTCASYMIVI